MGMYDVLLSPIKIGNVEIKNRFVVPPMDSGLPNDDGTINQKTIDYYSERAKGGFGLIVIEYSYVDPKGKPMPHTIGVWDDKFIPGLKQLADSIHQYEGAKVFLQLHHCGREGNAMVTGSQLEAPSAVACPVCKQVPKPFTTEEVYELVEKFGDAAVRAQKAGFDGVEIHGGHGYLVAQFMSAYSNKRLDEFGGSFMARMKFPELIIKNIKRKVGNSFPISMRISGEERVNDGRDINETKMAIKYLESEGLNAVNVSTGVYAAHPWVIVSNNVPSGYNLYAAEAIKKSVDIPVIGGGRINDPYMAVDVIESGRADMVFLGRGSLADPYFPNKVASGEIDEITPCIACLQRCEKHLNNPGTNISCMMNPFCGYEGELKIEKTENKKKINIVGAGPAGLEAAWILAKRGNDVTVFEKKDTIGGQFAIGSIPPFKHEIGRGLKYLQIMCEKYKVKIQYNTEVTDETALQNNPDAVILATGGTPIIPGIQGIDGEKIVLATDILEGKALPMGNILIIGGGEVGVETADFLGERYNRITLVEMLPQVAEALNPSTKVFLLKRLTGEYGVRIMTNTKVKEFLKDGIICETNGEEKTLNGFDSIVLAMGAKAYNPLENELKNKVRELYVIGDAVKARTAQEAIEEAARLAVRI